MKGEIEEIKSKIYELREDGHFNIMEDYTEDFVESRHNWNDLAENYRELYRALINIEHLIEDII